LQTRRPDMAPEPIRNAAGLPSAFAYVHTDVPPEMTLTAWRRRRGTDRAGAPCRSTRSSARAVRLAFTGLIPPALRGRP
jgi:hypothetical protein